MNTGKERVSYCIGLETARNIQKQFTDMDLVFLRNGFEDGVSNNVPKLSAEEIQEILNKLNNQIEHQKRQHIVNLSEHNRKEGEAFLEKNKREPGIVELKSGMQYKVLESGSGKRPTNTDIVTMHYRGSFIDGSIFDSSYERGQPQQFPVNRVIPGWAEILKLMQVGDKWKVFIPHYLAYGDSGFGNEIGPCTTLVFEMELLDVSSL
jgi:FKBP-type peptidyl-prolyl cis-trans isomerase FklB